MPHDTIDNRTRELAPEIKNFLSTPLFFGSGKPIVVDDLTKLD